MSSGGEANQQTLLQNEELWSSKWREARQREREEERGRLHSGSETKDQNGNVLIIIDRYVPEGGGKIEDVP